MNVQIWLSENCNPVYDTVIKGLSGGQYIQVGNIVDGRRMMRLIIDSTAIIKIIERFKMYGKEPKIIAVQTSSGTDYSAVRYQKNRLEFDRFMDSTNFFNNGLKIIPATGNCAAGWADFQ
jgi:hypothetical protein